MNVRKPIDQAAGTARTFVRRTERLGRRAGSLAAGKAAAVTRPRGPKMEMDDVTLKGKVETEIFRSADAPKGSVDVSVVDHVVELRGEVRSPDVKRSLEAKARAIPEVSDVRNLLHLPNVPAPGRADSPGHQRRKSPA